MIKPPQHDPVMLNELQAMFNLKPGDIVADGTLGLGGHASAFLEKIQPDGELYGFDWDGEMMDIAKERVGEGANVHYINRDFRAIPEEVEKPLNAVLLDIGLNSAQVDDPTRGLSFLKDGPLDMRMDRSRGETAAGLLNRWTPGQIEKALKELGDERWAKRIAEKIVQRRKEKPLKTTNDLVECVLAAIPVAARDKRIHPATRTFQAIRLATTSELEGLADSLIEISAVLAPGGTLAVLSYHSGEDRIVKHTFRDLVGDDFEDLTPKPMIPTDTEIRSNPRSRSAKLRAIRRIQH